MVNMIYFIQVRLAIEAGSPLIILSDADEEEIESIDDYTGKGTDTLQFSFDLIDKNERLLSALVMNARTEKMIILMYTLRIFKT